MSSWSQSKSRGQLKVSLMKKKDGGQSKLQQEISSMKRSVKGTARGQSNEELEVSQSNNKMSV
jgi:hypothetical protein